MMQQARKLLLFLAIGLWVGGLEARVFLPSDVSEFYHILEQHPLAVVHFVKFDKGAARPEGVDDFKEALRNLSRKKDYEYAGVAFIGVNIMDMPQLERSFKISDDSTVFLFHRGRVVQDGGKDATIVGFVDEDTLEDFIEKHFSDSIDDAIQHFKQARREQKAGQRPAMQTPVYAEPQTTQTVYYDDSDYGSDYYLTPGYGYYGWGYPWYQRRWGYGGWGAGWGGRGWGGGRGFHGGGHRGGGRRR